MSKQTHWTSFFVVFLSVFLSAFFLLVISQVAAPPAQAAKVSSGSLQILSKGKRAGYCPLRHTDVKADISGFLARVEVTQEFENPATEKIEAMYTFPLPQDAAVDDMTVRIGSRTVRGVIKRREEAAKIYQQAIQQGKAAALLDQERPNIFTQSVGNIPPGEAVTVIISYLVRLKYEDGSYEFVFPMVVGPRYIPGQPTGAQGGGFAPDTDQVPDASKVTPRIPPPDTRAGHDISVAVVLDAGLPVHNLRSPTHAIDFERTGAGAGRVHLCDAAEIPNKDFILRYDVAGEQIAEGLLTHAEAGRGGYFTLILQPPRRFLESDVTPKELVFVLDSSGSMGGFPIEKSKRLISYAIDGLYPADTFNVIKFSGETAVLFEQPVYPTAENVERAKAFVEDDWGGGGTEMMKAIRAALQPSGSADHVRIVVFCTDGYVGNDMDIIAEIQKHPAARVFSFGIGSSVNRFLLDKMAEAGHGEVEYVSQKQNDQEAETAAHRLYERLRAPLLTDIALDFGSLPVTEVYPKHIRDLFSGRPVVVTGRYTAPAKGIIRLLGRRAGDPYAREVSAVFPAEDESNQAIASLWAREKIDHLMAQDWSGVQQGTIKPALQEEITKLGLEYRLMTQFTSFVAVEERVVTEGGQPKRVQIPVELPEGVQHEPGWSGDDAETASMVMASRAQKLAAPAMMPRMMGTQKAMAPPPPSPPPASSMGGVVGAVAAGVVGSTVSSPAIAAPQRVRVSQGVVASGPVYSVPPTYPPLARQARIQGAVVLQATIGKDGTVQKLQLVSGHPMLALAAIEAVKQWRYRPYELNGQPVEVETLITVNFTLPQGSNGKVSTSSGVTTAAGAQITDTKLTPRLRKIDRKLHPKLVAAYDCWQAQADKSKAAGVCHLKGDNLAVQIVVSGEQSAALEKLKSLGFEAQTANLRNQIAGRITIEKLAEVAELPMVEFVAPATANSIGGM